VKVTKVMKVQERHRFSPTLITSITFITSITGALEFLPRIPISLPGRKSAYDEFSDGGEHLWHWFLTVSGNPSSS
jgi:hypothetical protein